MEKTYIFFNSADKKHNSSEYAELLDLVLESPAEFIDICDEYQPKAFKDSCIPGCDAIICGGDNTLSWFINWIYPSGSFRKISFCTCDSKSDFTADIDADDILVDITDYLDSLPSVVVNCREYKFINGAGFGLEMNFYDSSPVYKNLIGRIRAKAKVPKKEHVFNYDCIDIEAEVDGERYSFDDVWVCPVMNGRYCSDGMMIAPDQERLNDEGVLSLVVLHNTMRWRAFRIMKTLYRGRNRSGCKKINILTGSEITVKFSKPSNIQIDGNSFHKVEGYHVFSAKK